MNIDLHRLFACIRGDFDAVQSLLLSEGIDVDYCNHVRISFYPSTLFTFISLPHTTYMVVSTLFYET